MFSFKIYTEIELERLQEWKFEFYLYPMGLNNRYLQATHSLCLRRNHRQHNIVLVLLAEVQVVQTRKLLLAAILRVVVAENASALRITARNLKNKLAALLDHHVGRPHFNVDFIDGVGLDFLHVGAAIFAVGQPLFVFGVLLVNLAQACAEPALGQGDGVAGGYRCRRLPCLLERCGGV